MTVTETDLGFAGIAELAPRIAAGEVSSVALTEAALARIETRDPALNAFMTVTAESARAAARTAEAEIARGRVRGPLHGVPLAVKDLFATEGVRTTGGSKLLADWMPDHDAAAVERLKAAGAVLLGKTGMHELAYGTTSNNAHSRRRRWWPASLMARSAATPGPRSASRRPAAASSASSRLSGESASSAPCRCPGRWTTSDR
jgi:aspartyl-tRNA(Asn)/glutamyl-tRNA(Gln) amidotransferase subunit A